MYSIHRNNQKDEVNVSQGPYFSTTPSLGLETRIEVDVIEVDVAMLALRRVKRPMMGKVWSSIFCLMMERKRRCCFPTCFLERLEFELLKENGGRERGNEICRNIWALARVDICNNRE